MKDNKLNIVYIPVEELKPYDNNPRVNDESVPFVAASIERFGWQQPVVIDKDNVIIAGHTRYKAALELGLKTIPCKYADELTPEEVDAYRLADNKTAELATWDAEKLTEELAKLADFDMTAFGFEEMEEPEDPGDAQEDNYIEEDVEPLTQPGDIFQLGDHRLMCGDSTKTDDMDRLFARVKPEFVFTDPPYGVSIGDKNKFIEENTPYGVRIKKNIAGDTLDAPELEIMLTATMTNLREHCADSCSYYVSAPQSGDLTLMMLKMMNSAGLPVKHTLIWVKNQMTFSLGRLDYEYRHEPIYYTWTKSHNFYGGAQNSVIEDEKRLEDMTKGELKELVHALRDREETSVIYCDKIQHCDLHPTMKPIKLIARFMTNSSKKGDPVADIFGGSGSTMIAAEQLGRKCYMMEIDPHYCDVIIDRWQKFTGKEAERILND